MRLNVDELRNDIRRRLGGSKRCIELEDADIDDAMTKALDELSRYFPREALSGLTGANASVSRYVVDFPGIIDVIEVYFIDPFQVSDRVTENPFLNASNTGISYLEEAAGSEYQLQLGYLEDLRRVMSSRVEWHTLREYNPDNNKNEFVIYLDMPIGFIRYTISFRYMVGYTLSNDNRIGLPSVPETYTAWVRDYARAEARELLGDIRNKFGGIPSPDVGGSSEIDGSSMIDRAVADKEKLIEDIRGRQRQIPIIYG